MSSKLHPDGKLNPSDSVTNSSGNDTIIDLIEARMVSRRAFLKTSVGATTLAVVGGTVAGSLSEQALAKPASLKKA